MIGVTEDTLARLTSRFAPARNGELQTAGENTANFKWPVRTLLVLAALLGAVLVLDSGPLQAQQPQLAPANPTLQAPRGSSERLVDVRVEGNTTIPASAIARHIQTRPGRTMSEKQVRADVRALYDTRWFYSVEPIVRHVELPGQSATNDVNKKLGKVLIFKVLERPIVRKVEYRGLVKIKKKHIAPITGLKIGSPFDVSANKESARRIERYIKEKGHTFAKVELLKGDRKTDREVIFQISEGPKVKIQGVKFEGNEFFSSAVLKTKLNSKPAWVRVFGGKYDPAAIPADVASLTDYYHSLGFFDVKIDYDVKFSDDRDSAFVHYNIKEGRRFKVGQVVINGNNVLTREQLAGDLNLKAGEFFNQADLNKDLEAMRTMYGERGHMFASVNAIPRFLNRPGVANLQYEIEEDRPYTIRRVNIHIHGDSRTKRAVPLNYILTRPGDLANPKLIDRSRTRLAGTQLFEREPGKEPTVNISRVQSKERTVSSTDEATRGQSPDAKYTPYNPDKPGRPTYYGHTPTTPIQASSQYAHGSSTSQQNNIQPLTTSTIKDPAVTPTAGPATYSAQDGLHRPYDPLLENPVAPDPFQQALIAPPGQVDLDYYLNEARTGRFMFGVGVNSDAGVIGQIVLDESNFDIFRPPTSINDLFNGTAWRGGGQRFRLEAVPGDIVSRYAISWSDPFFLNTNYSLGVSGFYYERFMPDWDEDRVGGRITLGRLLTRELSISGAFRIEEVEIKNPETPTPADLAAVLGTNLLTTFRVSLTHDTRDSAFLPSEGHFARVGYEQAFGDFDYPRFDGEYRQYFTTYSRADGRGKHVLTVGGQLGWTGDDTPIFERFYAGGYQTFRGFAFRGIGPRVGDVNIGGNWMGIGTVEYKLPVTANEMLQMVVFSDFGTVEPDPGFEDIRVSVGAGIRLTIPALGPVPLAFDWGIPVVREDSDDTRVFSFYVGVNR